MNRSITERMTEKTQEGGLQAWLTGLLPMESRPGMAATMRQLEQDTVLSAEARDYADDARALQYPG